MITNPIAAQECDVQTFAELTTTGSLFGITAGNLPLGPTPGGTVISPLSFGKPSYDGFAAWVVGTVEDEPRISGNSPWFLDTVHRGPYPSKSAESCDSQSIYRLTRDDIELWLRNRMRSPQLENWPWRLGAPVIDGDGDLTNYNIDGGDLPALYGEQMVWWVMHTRSTDDVLSMDLEFRVSAYVHAGSGALENTLFLSYEIVNAGTKKIDSAQMGFSVSTVFMEDMLAGTDTSRASVFAYPANNFLDDGTPDLQPALSFVLLQDLAENDPERTRLFASNIILVQVQYPRTQLETRNLLLGRQIDGSIITEGGIGTSSVFPPVTDIETRFMFAGDPFNKEFWSMQNVFGEPTGWIFRHPDGRAQSSLDYLYLTGKGVTIEPGESYAATIALVAARAENSMSSLERVFEYVDLLRANSVVLLNPTVESIDPEEQIPGDLLFTMYPNPTDGQLSLHYSIPAPARIRIRVFDALGRIMAEPVNSMQQSGMHTVHLDVSAWSPGSYFVRYEIANRAFTRTMMVL